MKYNDFLGGLVALAFVSMPLMAVSQDFEDDIYYNPSKEKTTKSQKSTAPIRYVPTQDYPAADTYNYSSASTRDVDEYNRRYATTADTTARDSAYISDNFAYTRRIERFHNPDVVAASGDDQLIDYYYSQPSETSSVNIYVNADPYLGWGIYPYYGYYGYRPYYSYYNPWYSWRWTFDPWYWGSSWTWGYDPYWYGGWGYPYWAWSSPCPPHHHITAMDPVRHGIRLRPGLIDLTVRHLPEAPRVAALARRTTGTRLPEVECHVPAIWVVAVAIPLPQHHRHLRAPTDMLRHPQARVPRQDIAAEALADDMAIALRPPKAVPALTPPPADHPHPAPPVGRLAAVAEAGRIAAVVEADRMVVGATVEADVEAVVVVDKAIGNSLLI